MKARSAIAGAIAGCSMVGLAGITQSSANDGQRLLNAIIGGGAQMMLNEAERARQAPPQRRIQNASRNSEPRLNPDEIFVVQTRLNQLGYNVGTPDGVIGFDTKLAITRYQESIGAETTGALTLGQYRALIDGMPSVREITSNNPDLLTPAEAEELQRALKARGYAVGKIDGVLGSNSAKAIAQYLRDNGHDPNQTSLRSAFELASGKRSTGTDTGRAGSSPAVAETAARNSGVSPAVIPAAFNLQTEDGAILTGDASEMARGNDYVSDMSSGNGYVRQLRRLSLQLTYQADPDILERNPFLFAPLLSEEQQNRFIIGYVESDARNVDDDLLMEFRALNEFEAQEVRREMIGALRQILDGSRISLPVDLLEVRLFSVAEYDHETGSFPLRVDGANADARALRFSSQVPLVAPLPFSIWPERIFLNEADARSFLSNRRVERGGYIATRTTLASVAIDNGKLRFTLRFKDGALYRDRNLREKEFDLAPYPGADSGAEEAESSAFTAVAPDTPFALFAKENAYISIHDNIWRSAARIRFHYEKALLADNARNAVGKMRFPEDLLRGNRDLRDSHVRVYRDSVQGEPSGRPARLLCPADPVKEGDEVVVKMNWHCGFDLESAVGKDTLDRAARVTMSEGEALAVVMHNKELAGLLTMPVNLAEFDLQPRIKLSDLNDSGDVSDAAYEFRIERVSSDVVQSSGHQALFALNVRPTGIHVGKTFIPIERLLKEVEIADVSKFADIVELTLGMSADAVETTLAAHKENLQDPEIYRYTQAMDTLPAAHKSAFDRWFGSGVVMQTEIFNNGPRKLTDQTGVFFDTNGKVVAINRYQALPAGANIADIRQLIMQKYGSALTEKENGNSHWTGIWAQDPVTQRRLQSSQDIIETCGIGTHRSGYTDPSLTPSIWKNEQGAEFPRGSIATFYLSEIVKDCGPILIADAEPERVWLGLIDLKWLAARQQSLVAIEEQATEEKRKQAVAPVRF